MLGYACYAERFAGDLRAVGERVPYLVELGVTYLHLMPLLQPRPGPTTAATPSWTTAPSGPTSGRWRTCPSWRAPCAAAASP
jgi:glycosidase